MKRLSRRSKPTESAEPRAVEGGTPAYPRRSSAQPHEEASQQGWRTTRRSSKTGKKIRREVEVQRVRGALSTGARSAGRGVLGVLRKAGTGFAVLAVAGGVLYLLAIGINAGARWLALHEAERQTSPAALAAQAKDNLLIIGADESGSADFLAVRLDEEDGQILGIGIPSGAFVEVPGQGYERVGQSLSAGPSVAMAAISNYLSVQFARYVIVDVSVYQDAMANGSLRDVMAGVKDTNLSEKERSEIAEFMASVSGEKTALVPLPVQPVDLGSETYYEPQRDQIADLLKQWWGVSAASNDTVVRVIIYNGVGTPGIAGEAAQQLIEAGLRVVDTRNADRFDYAKTLVVVQDGNVSQGSVVSGALGVGQVIDQQSDQDVADVIVIIGSDYKPPAAKGQGSSS